VFERNSPYSTSSSPLTFDYVTIYLINVLLFLNLDVSSDRV
jgi:hypothetical protein